MENWTCVWIIIQFKLYCNLLINCKTIFTSDNLTFIFDRFSAGLECSSAFRWSTSSRSSCFVSFNLLKDLQVIERTNRKRKKLTKSFLRFCPHSKWVRFKNVSSLFLETFPRESGHLFKLFKDGYTKTISSSALCVNMIDSILNFCIT